MTKSVFDCLIVCIFDERISPEQNIFEGLRNCKVILLNTAPTTHPHCSLMICSSPNTKVTFLSKASDPKGIPMDAGLIHSLTRSNVFAITETTNVCQRFSHFGGFHKATLNNTPHCKCTLWSIMLGGQVCMMALHNFLGGETKQRTNTLTDDPTPK